MFEKITFHHQSPSQWRNLCIDITVWPVIYSHCLPTDYQRVGSQESSSLFYFLRYEFCSKAAFWQVTSNLPIRIITTSIWSESWFLTQPCCDQLSLAWIHHLFALKEKDLYQEAGSVSGLRCMVDWGGRRN